MSTRRMERIISILLSWLGVGSSVVGRHARLLSVTDQKTVENLLPSLANDAQQCISMHTQHNPFERTRSPGFYLGRRRDSHDRRRSEEMQKSSEKLSIHRGDNKTFHGCKRREKWFHCSTFLLLHLEVRERCDFDLAFVW